LQTAVCAIWVINACVAQQDFLEQTGLIEGLFEPAPLQAIGVAGGLHDGRTGRRVTTHEQRNADHTFVADASRFGRGAGLHHVVQRDDRGGWKIGVLQLHVRFVEHLAEQERHQFQMRNQRFKFRRWQSGKQMVLIRAME